jgi:hypothetical protein
MKIKLFGMLVALTLILGNGGYAQAMGVHGGSPGGTGASMGPGSMTHDTGSMGPQRMDQDTGTPPAQSQGETGQGHVAPDTEGAKHNPRSHQGHGGLMGGPPYCP